MLAYGIKTIKVQAFQNQFIITTIRLANYAVNEIIRKKMLQPDMPHMTIYAAHALCILIIKTTNIHSENVIMITVPRQ